MAQFVNRRQLGGFLLPSDQFATPELSKRLTLSSQASAFAPAQLGMVSPKIERNTSWAAATLPLVNAL
jgi:hypothetical protein